MYDKRKTTTTHLINVLRLERTILNEDGSSVALRFVQYYTRKVYRSLVGIVSVDMEIRLSS